MLRVQSWDHINQSANFVKSQFFSAHQENPLHDAARQGDLDTVRRLTDEGIDVNIKDDKGVSTNNSLRKGQCYWFGFELALFAGHYSFFSYAVEKAKFLLFGFQTFSSKVKLQCRDTGNLCTFRISDLNERNSLFFRLTSNNKWNAYSIHHWLVFMQMHLLHESELCKWCAFIFSFHCIGTYLLGSQLIFV